MYENTQDSYKTEKQFSAYAKSIRYKPSGTIVTEAANPTVIDYSINWNKSSYRAYADKPAQVWYRNRGKNIILGGYQRAKSDIAEQRGVLEKHYRYQSGKDIVEEVSYLYTGVLQPSRPGDLIDRLKDEWTSQRSIKLIDVYNRANRAYFDALTAVATLPQSVRTWNNLVDKLANMNPKRVIKNARKFWDRENRLRQLRKKYKSPKQMRELEAQRLDGVARALGGLGDQLADSWMMFRYGIMTQVYDILGATDAVIREHPKSFPIHRDWEALTLDLEDSRIVASASPRSVNITEVRKASIRNGFTLLSKIAALSPSHHRYFADLGVTWWEIMKFSWVMDWVIPVGDYFNATRVCVPSYARRGCESLLVNWSVSYLTESTYWEQGSELSWAGSGSVEMITELSAGASGWDYTRIPSIPQPSIADIMPNVHMTFKRQVDALALMWRPIRRKLLR